MKPLQNYIEEEIKKFEKEFKPNYDYPFKKVLELLVDEQSTFLSQSLHRIAEITAREIVPKKLKPIDTDFPGYKFAIRDMENNKLIFFGKQKHFEQ